MPDKFVAVNPLRNASGAFATLAPIFGDANSQPAPLPPGATLNNFNVYFTQTTFSLAATLKVSAIFDGSFSANESAFFFDYLVSRDEYKPAPSPQDAVLGTRWAVGLRVAFRVQNLDAKVSASFSALSAQVDAGFSSAEYEVQGLGVGLPGLKIVTDNIGQLLGNWKYDSYYKMNMQVIPGITNYMVANIGSLQPQPVAVYLSNAASDQPMNQARAAYFAYRWISEQKPLADALKMPETAITSPDMVTLVYNRVMPGAAVTDVPSNAARDAARAWLEYKF